MSDNITRRALLKDLAATGAASVLASGAAPRLSAAADGAVVPRTSTDGVLIPSRGRSFQKFSFDFPEPSVAFHGFEFGFRVFTYENVYGLAADHLTTRPIDRGLEIVCTEFVWAGGQQRSGARLTARLTRRAEEVDCETTVEMERPIKAVAAIVRGIPRGRLSAAGAPFFDPRDDEVLLGYPFSGGDLIGPQGNGGLTTPLVLIQPPAGAVLALSSLDDRVRTKRLMDRRTRS